MSAPDLPPDLTALRELRLAAHAARDELTHTSELLAGEPGERLAGAARRLTDSVLRPLDDLLGADVPQTRAATEVPTLWALAVRATTLRAASGAPAALLEATAALQDIACAYGSGDGPEGADAKLAEFRRLQAELAAEIQPAPNGPYLVTNVEDLRDWLGCTLTARPQMALCRCGASALKPFCDGAHARVGFSDEKSPERVPDRRDTYVGQQVTVLDNRGVCQHSGFCTDRLATVFHADGEPFVTPSGGRMDEIIRAVRDCPSGALSYAIDGVEARGEVDYHGTRAPAIEVSKDGPYRVTGGVLLRDAEGGAVPQGEGASSEHYALCRCGGSRNKPFCSGMHWYNGFSDPVPDPERTPTMFEWCGGLPALTRMTRLFYEKHVPQDPMLAPLFATMSADHPERVARWLGEVFGGPPLYSEAYGGYPRMLSQHRGKNLSEAWRARWVALLLESAREAGLPNDAEFRSAFQAYIEWGSRLAVENSQPGARPPERMPMPRWDWNTGAGSPGSRVSALAPLEEVPEAPVTLPAAGEPLGFEAHIRPLFRARDRGSMRFAFDLWSYEDVKKHADAILERVRNGSMPCDGPWPREQVEAFERWAQSGAPK